MSGGSTETRTHLREAHLTARCSAAAPVSRSPSPDVRLSLLISARNGWMAAASPVIGFSHENSEQHTSTLTAPQRRQESDLIQRFNWTHQPELLKIKPFHSLGSSRPAVSAIRQMRRKVRALCQRFVGTRIGVASLGDGVACWGMFFARHLRCGVSRCYLVLLPWEI